MVDRMTRMDREADGNLLLSCLGVETNGRSRAFERLSQRDWDDVLYQSAHHRVAALLYDRLAALPTSAAIPAPVMQQLRDMALQDALSNMRLYDALTEVLTAFAREGVSVIVLKGAHLAEVVYGNRALRPMADADLLVRSRDLARAEATLVGLGYGRLESTTGEVDYAFHHHLRPFVRTGVATIEIHWTVARPIVAFTIDVDGLWARARRAVIAGVEAL